MGLAVSLGPEFEAVFAVADRPIVQRVTMIQRGRKPIRSPQHHSRFPAGRHALSSKACELKSLRANRP